MAIERVAVFVCATDAGALLSKVYQQVERRPPHNLLALAERALGLGGQLTAWCADHPMKPESVPAMTEAEWRELLDSRYGAGRWRSWRAETQFSVYTVVVVEDTPEPTRAERPETPARHTIPRRGWSIPDPLMSKTLVHSLIEGGAGALIDATGMAVCDMCQEPVEKSSSCMLTTTQVVTEPAYWVFVFEHTLRSVPKKDPRGKSVPRLAKRHAARAGAWRLCLVCAGLFKFDFRRAQAYAILRAPTVDGIGPADPKLALEAAVRAWEELFGEPPMPGVWGQVAAAWQRLLKRFPPGLVERVARRIPLAVGVAVAVFISLLVLRSIGVTRDRAALRRLYEANGYLEAPGVRRDAERVADELPLVVSQFNKSIIDDDPTIRARAVLATRALLTILPPDADLSPLLALDNREQTVYGDAVNLVRERKTARWLIRTSCDPVPAARAFAVEALRGRFPLGEVDARGIAQLQEPTGVAAKAALFQRLYDDHYRRVRERLAGRYRIELSGRWQDAKGAATGFHWLAKNPPLHIHCEERDWSAGVGNVVWTGTVDTLAQLRLVLPVSRLPGYDARGPLAQRVGEGTLTIVLSEGHVRATVTGLPAHRPARAGSRWKRRPSEPGAAGFAAFRCAAQKLHAPPATQAPARPSRRAAPEDEW